MVPRETCRVIVGCLRVHGLATRRANATVQSAVRSASTLSVATCTIASARTAHFADRGSRDDTAGGM